MSEFTFRVQSSAIGLGSYGEGNRGWVRSEPDHRCTRAQFQFLRPVQYTSNGDPIPSGDTTMFDLWVLLRPMTTAGNAGANTELAKRAIQASWDRGAAGCVLHFLHPTNTPGSDLHDEDPHKNAVHLYDAMTGPLCGAVCWCPTAETQTDHVREAQAIEQHGIKVLCAVQEMFVAQAHIDADDWMKADPATREPRFVPRQCPPIGAIGDNGKRLLSLHDEPHPTRWSPVALATWLRRMDPTGFGAELGHVAE